MADMLRIAASILQICLVRHFNEAGDLAFAGMKVKIEKTGKKQPLSRLESIMGVYGVGLGEEH